MSSLINSGITDRRLQPAAAGCGGRSGRLPVVPALLLVALLLPGLLSCLPTLRIEGEFTVLHQVVHSVDQQGREGREVTVRELKVMGLIGEQYDGYLGLVVPEVDEEIAALVERVNAERRQRYQEMADQYPGIESANIEIRAGQALIDREQAGFFIQAQPDAPWHKK